MVELAAAEQKHKSVFFVEFGLGSNRNSQRKATLENVHEVDVDGVNVIAVGAGTTGDTPEGAVAPGANVAEKNGPDYDVKDRTLDPLLQSSDELGLYKRTDTPEGGTTDTAAINSTLMNHQRSATGEKGDISFQNSATTNAKLLGTNVNLFTELSNASISDMSDVGLYAEQKESNRSAVLSPTWTIDG
eukprot:UN27857